MNTTDYKNIKEQMTDMIFNRKKVRYDQQLFDAYYDRMFPDYDAFRKFLGTSGKDVMQNAAKKIADRLLFDSVWNGTQFLFDNLLSFETQNLSVSGESYVPQDHVVHSVHLYLLGIYFYFNSSVFHSTLFPYFADLNIQSEYSYSRKEKAFCGFLEAWKVFALLHDVAYPYEAAFDVNGCMTKKEFEQKLQKYRLMTEYMCYYAAMEYLAGLIFVNILTQQADYELRQEMNDECRLFRERKTGKRFEEFAQEIVRIQKYRKLKGIRFNEDYRKCSQYFNNKDCAILIKNREYDLIGILVQTERKRFIFGRDRLSGDDHELLERIEKASRLEIERRGIFLEFFIPDNIDKILNKGLNTVHVQSRRQLIDEISREVKKAFSVELASGMLNKNLSDILYHIMIYLMEKCPPDSCIPARSFATAIPADILKNRKWLLRETILDEIRAAIDKMMEDYRSVLTETEITELLNHIQNINMETLSSDIGEKYYSVKYQKDIDVINVIEVFQKISHEFVEGMDQISEKDQKFFMDIYRCFPENVDASFSGQICQLLKKESFIQNGDSIDVFLNYRTDYSCYDHGVAAGIVAAVYLDRKKTMCEKLSRRKIPLPGNYDMDLKPALEQAVYAILVHNIYTGRYETVCGNLPQHTLLLNPLNYFGMFCDNLQVWDRNKGLDFGLVKWQGNTLYGEDISICFENEKIRVICRTHDIVESFRKLKDSLEEYLEGSSRILSLNLLETGG